MKVYVVHVWIYYDDAYIDGVYSSRAAAERRVAELESAEPDEYGQVPYMSPDGPQDFASAHIEERELL